MVDINAVMQNVAQLVALSSGMNNNQMKSIRGGKIPETAGAYATIRLVTDRTIGKPSPKYTESGTQFSLNEEIKVATELQFTINFFRDGARQFANNMKSAAYRDAVRAFLFTNQMGWASYGPINDLTNFFSGYTEERAQAKLYLWLDGLDIGQIGQATNVEITITNEQVPEEATFYTADPQQGDQLPGFDNQI